MGRAGRQENFQPQEKCFFLTPFMELSSRRYRSQLLKAALEISEEPLALGTSKSTHRVDCYVQKPGS
jgi:hypothetical protein